ncbi:hypothetical protein KFK14_02340 [Sphingobium phenoxybenzoativorans]|uniref:Uncharacterized protein n=1 Tax=Sphingobium phenoxybenzoativorans TaxID=1592790 RepID=A0A975Q2D4_9SPHN|nr:hypothetical protein [Sphingobium phenoxybenzoativorans]QUT06342.1 hypothetical protein KFK14_02340 [Sphingobium phenoxybenzoativorans]
MHNIAAPAIALRPRPRPRPRPRAWPRRQRISIPFRAVITLAAMSALLSSITLIVAAAVGDILVGMMASLVAFTASAPVLGPVLGADSRGARS